MDNINLKQILIDFPDCITNGAKLKAILLDTYPEISKAIVNTLVIMANSGIAKEIQLCGQITNFELSRWSVKIEDDFGLSERFIEIGLKAWVKAIDDLRYSDFNISGNKLLKYIGVSRVVVVPNEIKYIRDEAFKNCVNLESIIIPEGVEYIGDYAFENCYNLENISLPQSLKKVGYNAFWHCPRLKTTDFNNISYIGNSNNPYLIALKGKKDFLVQCSLPQSTKIIYSNAFMDCSKLKRIKLPKLYYIGVSSFSGCEELEEVEVEKCHEIDEYAFSYCKKLKEVQIGNIKRVKKYAFENCRSVKDFSKPLIKVGEKPSTKEKIEIDVCYGRCSPFYNKYSGNFRLAYERYVKHDMFADYSDFSYNEHEIADEQDLRLNYGRPCYSYFIK